MSREVSISEAKDQLPRLIHDVEAGEVVQLTRRGKPVAVLLSNDAYHRLLPGRGDVWSDFWTTHRELGFHELGIQPEDWLEPRPDVQPRDVEFG